MAKRFVQISNNTNSYIRVIPGMLLVNSTNMKSPNRDRLNVKPAWQKFGVVVEPQLGFYPAEVASWETVKAMVKNKSFTIGVYCDETELPEAWSKKALDMEKKLKNAHAQYDNDVKKNKEIMEASKDRPINSEN